MPEHLPVMRRITEAFRQVADNMRRAREMEDTTRQVEAVFHGPETQPEQESTHDGEDDPFARTMPR